MNATIFAFIGEVPKQLLAIVSELISHDIFMMVTSQFISISANVYRQVAMRLASCHMRLLGILTPILQNRHAGFISSISSAGMTLSNGKMILDLLRLLSGALVAAAYLPVLGTYTALCHSLLHRAFFYSVCKYALFMSPILAISSKKTDTTKVRNKSIWVYSVLSLATQENFAAIVAASV